MDAGGNRCWFIEDRQPNAVDHGNCRGAQAVWFGCCDRRALRGRSLAGKLCGLSGHETRDFTLIAASGDCRFRLTAPPFFLDDCVAWTLNASLTTFSSCRKCSKPRTSGHSLQATSLPPIEGTTRCLRTARGFGCGGTSGFAAEAKPKPGLGFRASAASPVLKPRIERSNRCINSETN